MKYQSYNFEQLEVYRLAEDLVLAIYNLVNKFPGSELYGLSAQIKRSSVSIALNLAEGSSIRSTKDFERFVSIAIGSLMETKSALLIAKRLGFITDTELKSVMPKFDELFFKLIALKKALHEK